MGPPEMKTALVVLATRETPDERRSASGVDIGLSLWGGNVVMLFSPSPASPARPLPAEEGGGAAGAAGEGSPGVSDSTATLVCFGFGAHVAITRFEINRSRTATRMSSDVIDSIH